MQPTDRTWAVVRKTTRRTGKQRHQGAGEMSLGFPQGRSVMRRRLASDDDALAKGMCTYYVRMYREATSSGDSMALMVSLPGRRQEQATERRPTQGEPASHTNQRESSGGFCDKLAPIRRAGRRLFFDRLAFATPATLFSLAHSHVESCLNDGQVAGRRVTCLSERKGRSRQNAQSRLFVWKRDLVSVANHGQVVWATRIEDGSHPSTTHGGHTDA